MQVGLEIVVSTNCKLDVVWSVYTDRRITFFCFGMLQDIKLYQWINVRVQALRQ